MTSTLLFQILINLLLFTFTGLIWARLKHLSGDEGRLKQGLQILQTKISILEDLSQQVDDQFKQLNQMLELKNQLFDKKFTQATTTLEQLDSRLIEAQNITQQIKISLDPELALEKENAIKYVKAALMAHHGISPSDFAKKLNLNLDEAELIAKINTKELQVDLKNLPDWMLPILQNELPFKLPSEKTAPLSHPATPINYSLEKAEIKENHMTDTKKSDTNFNSSSVSGVEIKKAIFPRISV